jgi:hypothetical protein
MPRTKTKRIPFNLEPYLDGEGRLVHHVWPGGYPVFYLTARDEPLCPRCANRERDDLVAATANWENPALHCGHCNDRIESAYAEHRVARRAARC